MRAKHYLRIAFFARNISLLDQFLTLTVEIPSVARFNILNGRAVRIMELLGIHICNISDRLLRFFGSSGRRSRGRRRFFGRSRRRFFSRSRRRFSGRFFSQFRRLFRRRFRGESDRLFCRDFRFRWQQRVFSRCSKTAVGFGRQTSFKRGTTEKKACKEKRRKRQYANCFENPFHSVYFNSSRVSAERFSRGGRMRFFAAAGSCAFLQRR